MLIKKAQHKTILYSPPFRFTREPDAKRHVDHMLMTETVQFSSGFAAWQ
jgi:hypothetical protein